MNGPRQSQRRRFFLLLAPFLLGSAVIPASRSDAAENKAGNKTASATTVAEALKTIQRAGGEVAQNAAADKAKAEREVGVIEPLWGMIEDSIRANDQNSYRAFEDAIEDLEAAAKAGDAKKAGGAAGALTSAVQAYVAKFPGDAAPAAGAPRSAAAAPKQAPAPKEAPAAGDRTAAAAGDKQAAADSTTAPAAEAGDTTLARTGPSSALGAVAGAAFGLGGLALIGGARRRRSR